jgi:hypothetical protein
LDVSHEVNKSILTVTKILRQESATNFGFFSAFYNEAEREDGRDLAEDGYSPTSRETALAFEQLPNSSAKK